MKKIKSYESGNNKELHYELVRRYFKKNATLKSPEEVKREIKKRIMWKVYTSTLDEILQNNGEISSVIDVGCGMGNFTLELVEHNQFKKIVGIDFLKETIDITHQNKKRLGGVSFLQCDILNLPFNNKSFDLTLCLDTLHHIHKDDFSKAIHELARITNNYLMFEIRNKNYFLEYWFKNLLLQILYKDLPQYTTSIPEVNNLMKKHGFQLKIIRGRTSLNKTCRRLVLVYKRI